MHACFRDGLAFPVARQVLNRRIRDAALADRAKQYHSQPLANLGVVGARQRRSRVREECVEVVPIGGRVNGPVLGDRALDFKRSHGKGGIARGWRPVFLGLPSGQIEPVAILGGGPYHFGGGRGFKLVHGGGLLTGLHGGCLGKESGWLIVGSLRVLSVGRGMLGLAKPLSPNEAA